MDKPRTLQVLTNARGRILGAGFLTPGQSEAGEVQVRIEPQKGQSLVEVPSPPRLSLKTEEDFKALVAGYRVAKGKQALSPIKVGAARKRSKH